MSVAPVVIGWETSAQRSLAGGESMSMLSAPSVVAAGRTPGTFTVAQSRAATYTIPLWTPSGVGEVQFDLPFVYSSRAGNRVLGQGCSLQGLSAIASSINQNKLAGPDAIDASMRAITQG